MKKTGGQPLKTAKLEKPKPPKRQPNQSVRLREYLTPHEIERCLIAAKQTGQPALRPRNYALLLLMYRHALRASEVIALRWTQIDFQQGLLHVNRLKHGIPATHPLRGPELRALKALQRYYPITPYVFTSQRKTPLTARSVHHIVASIGQAANLPFPIHPHMLRHATGYYLASQGHDARAIQHYMGHRNIQNTVKYTELSPDRFQNFWED